MHPDEETKKKKKKRVTLCNSCKVTETFVHLLRFITYLSCLKADLISVGKHWGSRHSEQQELVETDKACCLFRQLVLLGGTETPAQTSLLRVKGVHGLDTLPTCTYLGKIIPCNAPFWTNWLVFTQEFVSLPLLVPDLDSEKVEMETQQGIQRWGILFKKTKDNSIDHITV